MVQTEFGTSPDEGKDRNFVTALARGLDVLRCFRPDEVSLSNLDLSERTGLPKPTISRLTHTLCQLGYLVHEPGSGTYRLGVGVLQLGFGVLAGMDICDRAADVLRTLRNGPNSYITAALAELHRAEVIYVAVHRSREDVSLSMHVGARLPLFRSAIGRAILAGLSDEARKAAVDHGVQDGVGSEADLTQAAHAACDEFEAKGYCTGYGEWRADVNGLAVPVFSLDGARVFGLNVGGPAFHVSPDELERDYSGLLTEAAAFLSFKP
ncbi:IclR family transcriptional regulator [Falsiruegeria mediterranea]|uniref:Pca regulon regulatory protein n=1 Tax=Falsiruegeria mediterranea M17 TaxID=1200281 RepID=A0A2R8C8W2_9RHOB|nr:IclR family transcriptional regulator [Falsiruegeria mediterranea]SPJ28813.1 Pca regulon regulatory protein [Falsiruegeria mediterranea M17]